MGAFVVGNWKQIVTLAIAAASAYAGFTRVQTTVDGLDQRTARIEQQIDKLYDRVSWGERSDQGEAGPAPPPQ